MTIRDHKNCQRVNGFTLVEFMISMTLGLVLIAGLLQIMSNHKMLINTETSLSRIQESGRFIMNMLAKDIRKIGYHGCSDPAEMSVVVMATAGVDANFGSTSLRGFEVDSGVFSPALAAGDALLTIQGGGVAKARSGSDVLQIKFADRTGAELTGNTDPVNANIQVDSNPTELSKDDIAIVADCQSAHIFSITNVVGGGGNVTMTHAASNNSPHKMLPGYGSGAELLSYQDLTYFVGDTGRNTNGDVDVFALYRKYSTSNTPEELIEGVEFLSILYGESVGTDNVRFVPAGTAGLDMQNVVAIRIAVLIQDFETSRADEDGINYALLDTTILADGDISHTGGRYLRKAFTATVQLRNTRSSE